MTPITLRKTLLALAVTSAPLGVFAETFDLSNGRVEKVGESYPADVTVNGTFNGGDYDAIKFDQTSIEHDLNINATISVERGTNDIQFDNADGLDIGGQTSIGNDLIINGRINVERLAAAGVDITGSFIGNDLVNYATISAKGTTLDNASARAIALSGSDDGGSTHVRDLINEGTLIAEGDHASGIIVANSIVDYVLSNKGSISVTGEQAGGIELRTYSTAEEPFAGKAYASEIDNYGTITAQGAGADGIRIDDAIIDDIYNFGTIKADGTAIVVNAFERTPESIAQGKTRLFITQNSGLLSGSVAAIQANGLDVNLDWNGGKIQGNILGLGGFIHTQGTTEFDGNRIEVGDTLRIGNPTDTVAGNLQLDQAHTTIAGNLLVTGNSSLGLYLSSATVPGSPVLSVTGNAEFANGAQIILAAKEADFNSQGQTYNLIQAGSLSNQGLSVTSTSSLLNIDAYQVSGNSVQAKVTTKNSQQVGEVIATGGGTGNARAAGGAFSSLVFEQLATSNPNDPVRLAFIAASQNPAELAKLAERLAPEVSGGATSAAVSGQSLVSNVTAGRTGSARTGLSSGEAFKDSGVWVQSLYSDADQGLRNGVAGYNAYSSGIALGVDGKVNEQLTLGVAYSYLNTNVNGTTGNKTEVDGHALTLYGGVELGNYFADGSLTYGKNDNTGKRPIAGTTAKADYDSDLLGLNLIGGYVWHVTPQFALEPRVAARYSQVDIDGYSEKGSSAALKVRAQRYEAGELGAGVRAVGNLAVGQGTLVPQAKLMAYHDLIADQVASTSTFVLGNTPFATSGAKPARNSYEASVGVDYRLGAVTVGLNYDYLSKSDFNADTFTAKVRYDF